MQRTPASSPASREIGLIFASAHREQSAPATEQIYGRNADDWDQVTLLSRRRAASESITREIPLNHMLIPTSMPMAQAVLADQLRQIIMAKTRVIIPSKNSQPEPGSGRRR